MYLVVVHVFGVPVTLQPVLGSVVLNEIIDSVPEVVWLQQKELDYEVANLSLISFMATHCLEVEKKSNKTYRHLLLQQKYGVYYICAALHHPRFLCALTRHKMSLSKVTMLNFQTMSLSISMHLLSCCPPADVENS